MTTPLIPDYIATLFDNEIMKIQEDIIDKICKQYKLDKTEVCKNIGFKHIEFTECNIKIIKCHATNYGTKKDEPKCIARIYNHTENILYQCKRSQKAGGHFCKTHSHQHQTKSLKWGTINDPIPKSITGNEIRKIY